MISTEVEARATLPTYMTYPDTWRTKQQPPEFLRPAPKPLSQLRYNGLSSTLLNGLTSHHHQHIQSQQISPPCGNGNISRPPVPPHCLPSSVVIPTNLPPTPSPSPSTPTTPLSTAAAGQSNHLHANKFSLPILVNNSSNNNNNNNGSNSSSPVNLSATSHSKGLVGDEMVPHQMMTAEDLQYTAYRIFAPSFISNAYNASPYAVYAAAAAAASSPYALLPPHHPATPRTAPCIPTATIAPPLSPFIDSYHSPTTTNSIHMGGSVCGGGSITTGASAKLAAGSITSGTSILRERRPPGVASTGGGFKIPSGKEGSLKHRILQTRPDERIGEALDLQQKGVETTSGRKRLCATLSPPPPTLAPPQAPSIPPKPHLPYQPIQPKHLNHNHYQTISPPISTPPQQPPTTCTSHLTNGGTIVKSPLIMGGSFTRGTFIQLGGGELRRVEDMRTEDFIQSAERSPGLRLAESTVVRIAENRATGGATVTLSYNERRTQVTQIEVESSWEHPYFVMGASWASCKPELTYQYYGLRVSRLQVGDVLVSLTPREHPTTSRTPPTTDNLPTSVTPLQANNPTTTTSNVANYNSHFRSPTSSHHQMAPYQQQHHGNSCTITTVTGTAMTARPLTYATHAQPLVLRHSAAHALHQLPVAAVPISSGCRSARSMSPDSLARKRRWSIPDQLSDDEQQPINRRSKTE